MAQRLLWLWVVMPGPHPPDSPPSPETVEEWTSGLNDLGETPAPRGTLGLSPLRPSRNDDQPRDYFLERGAFTRQEFFSMLRARGRTEAGAAAALKYHLRSKHLAVLRRGLYAIDEKTCFDPWAVAARLAPDAVLAYQSAATLFHLLPLGESMQILSAQRVPRVSYCQVVYAAIHAPKPREEEGVEPLYRGRDRLYVTTRERTLVDLLDRIDLCTDLTALRAAFRLVGPLDPKALFARARTLACRTTCARLGVILERLGSDYAELTRALELNRPPSPVYFHRKRRRDDRQTWLRRWNMLVPLDFLLGFQRER